MTTTTNQIAEAFTTFIEEDTNGSRVLQVELQARKALMELAKLAKTRCAETSEAKAEG
jgi:hypothetical protein